MEFPTVDHDSDTASSDSASVNTDSAAFESESKSEFQGATVSESASKSNFSELESFSNNLDHGLQSESTSNIAMESGLASQSKDPASKSGSEAGRVEDADISKAISESLIRKLDYCHNNWWPAHVKLHRRNLHQDDLLNFIIINNDL